MCKARKRENLHMHSHADSASNEMYVLCVQNVAAYGQLKYLIILTPTNT